MEADRTDPATLRRSPLDDRHRALGATMTAFAGWEMPLHYGSVVAEHTAVREGCGVFDLSHLGTLRVTGDGAEAAVARAFTADARSLPVGRAVYALCLDDDGGIVDDLLVYRLPWGFFVVPNAANAATVQAVLREVAGDGCEVADVKADMACIAIQGPRAAELATAAGVDVSDMAYLDCRVLTGTEAEPAAGGGAADAPVPTSGVLARSGYTGELGFEAFVPAEQAPTLWDRLTAAGATPAGLGARDTLRLEMGYPLHGQDISPATSPVEARLGWAVKGDGFRGEAAYRAAKEAGPRRRLWGLRATGRGIPRAGCRVRLDGRDVGETTSGTFSPTLRVGIALAYLDASVGAETEVEIDVRGKPVPAVVTRPPFVDRGPKG
ncbi:MAG TPA: glycine cleavage system aminomethyltransferase GcvT [Egibacteraceae bacterium]